MQRSNKTYCIMKYNLSFNLHYEPEAEYKQQLKRASILIKILYFI